MLSNEIRLRFLKFFKKRRHEIIPSSSLIPQNDSSVLFNTAGMQPLVPYFLGQKHPMGVRLVNSQKCVRTNDINEVGDNRHLTFFEMLGNWSMGDYFKKEAIAWSFDFLTDKEEGLGLNKDRLYITVFEGDENVGKDIEAVNFWKKYIPENRIYLLPAKNNWWGVGEDGPCGPDTEMFYDSNKEPLGDMTLEEFMKADNEGKVIEIWNNVFMQYEKEEGKIIGKLAQHNVDTGMGLERIAMVSQGVNTVFDTDLFIPIISKIKELSFVKNERIERIIADHIRTAVFMITDGVVLSNTGRGYILRRLLRRIIRFSNEISLQSGSFEKIIDIIVDKYKKPYPELEKNIDNIKREINNEEKKFKQTLEKGLREFEKGVDPFILFTTYGFPIELTLELATEGKIKIDLEDFNKKMKEHQDLSKVSSVGMFKGGLADHSEKTIKLHTAHHLLLAGIQAIIGSEVKQRGSNITEERLRIDFLCNHKLSNDEKKKIEDWVNDKIKKELKVVHQEMPLEEAIKIGAQMEFGTKYPEVVSIYFIEDEGGHIFSKEFCAGPHVKNTKVLGHFKIKKEESVAFGIRRIKAILE